MPSLSHEIMFQARHYECDAAGRLYYAIYLRYMQETAMAATAAAGYSVARYEEMGRQWLVRESDLTVHRPLRYGDRVVVRTYVAGFRRIHSRRIYEMRMADSGEPVATAHTDWIFVDVVRQRPVTVPDELMRALFPDGDAVQPRYERFPEPPPPPPDAFLAQRRVRWSDLDTARHVNNAQYAAFIEDTLAEQLAARAWKLDRLRATGLVLNARRWQIDYREAARFGDDLVITTWFAPVEDSTLHQHVIITRRDDSLRLVQARVSWQWHDPATRAPAAVPADFAAEMVSQG